ncbi:haloacid dehalogenase [Auriculariales sp. MPI-PUGE-AT-0066]|nr:haloacid dehalogenase [Auriculariales sp. MPI-PUGE-AT-0066]
MATAGVLHLPSSPLGSVKALVFDIVGTMTDWLSPVQAALEAHHPSIKLNFNATEFAYEWRAAFFAAAKGSTATTRPHTLFRSTLDEVCSKHGIGLEDWDDATRSKLIASWADMKAWSDTIDGMERLRTKFILVGLSNLPAEVLVNAHRHNGMHFDLLLAADGFDEYKPSPSTYGSVLEALRLQGHECAMVAAHVYDLRGARSTHGFRTIYVVRNQELVLEPPEARDGNIMRSEFDLVVEEATGGGGGLLEVAAALEQLRGDQPNN